MAFEYFSECGGGGFVIMVNFHAFFLFLDKCSEHSDDWYRGDRDRVLRK